MKNRLLVAIFAIAGSVLSVAPALSQDAVFKHVGYADLNLAQPEGRAVLQHRIDAAITDVCGATDPRDLATIDAIKHCRDTARDSARAQVALIVESIQVASKAEQVRVAAR